MPKIWVFRWRKIDDAPVKQTRRPNFDVVPVQQHDGPHHWNTILGRRKGISTLPKLPTILIPTALHGPTKSMQLTFWKKLHQPCFPSSPIISARTIRRSAARKQRTLPKEVRIISTISTPRPTPVERRILPGCNTKLPEQDLKRFVPLKPHDARKWRLYQGDDKC